VSSIGWKFELGARPYRVIAEERLDRDHVVYLRWWEGGRWTRSTTGQKVRNGKREIVRSKEEAVERLVKAKHRDLVNDLPSGRVAPDAPLTILGAIPIVKHPSKGLYPLDSPHRREVLRELTRAAALLGERKTWNEVTPGNLAEVYRVRAGVLLAKDRVGRRGAEITVTRLLTVAEWLRGEGKISPTACRAQRRWRSTLGAELEKKRKVELSPSRPRHSIEELRSILSVAGRVDPRLDLALQLGAELRLGQVLRARRADLNLEEAEFRVRGDGRKVGTKVSLLPSQLAAAEAALSGHLAPLETLYRKGEIPDYPLFPSGQMTGGRRDVNSATCRPEQASAPPIHRRAVLAWFHEAEHLAGVPRVAGRGWYGLRRANVDGAKDAQISPDGLKQFGGWSGTEIPDQIYAERQSKRSISEASTVRAKIRGTALAHKVRE